MNKFKQRRTLQRLINLLFKKNAFIDVKNIDDIKKLDNYLAQELKLTDNKVLYITLETRANIVKIVNILINYYELEGVITFSEIFSVFIKNYTDYILNGKKIDNMMDDIYLSIGCDLNKFDITKCLEGIEFIGFDELVCGRYKIKSSNYEHFIKMYGGSNKEQLYNKMKNYLWISGTEEGSKKSTIHKFDYNTNIIANFLCICFQLINKKSIFSYRIQMLNDSSTHKSEMPALQKSHDDDNGSFSYSFPTFFKAELTKEILEYFKKDLFFDNFFEILENNSMVEVDEAILRSVYWYGEAIKDNNKTMKFIKLWSCIECFFSINKDEISESNAKGLACILVYGGYRIDNIKNYKNLKTNIKKMYSKRSKALHRAYWSEIAETDVIELAHWVAWLIINILALRIEGNYKKLAQIEAQASRLDNIHNRKL